MTQKDILNNDFWNTYGQYIFLKSSYKNVILKNKIVN